MSKKNSGSSRSRRERRVFTEEFKREAVRLLEERRKAGVSLAQVGRELDVGADQLRVWAQYFDAKEGAKAAGAQGESEAAEIRRLRRELETVRQERDFLKKAAAFFAKESR